VLRCVTVCYGVLQCVGGSCASFVERSVCALACCSVLQCVAVCCYVLLCLALCCSVGVVGGSCASFGEK